MEDKIYLERHKNSDYIVRYTDNGRNERYTWKGAKGNKFSKVGVPDYVYNYLAMSTTCFKNGELIISEVKDKDKKEELESVLFDQETVKANSFTKEEVISILKSTVQNMKKNFDGGTSQTTKDFIIEVAKEIGLSNTNKLKYLKDLVGSEMSIEDLFGIN